MQMFQPGISTIQALLKSVDALVRQHYFSHLDESIICLGAHSFQGVRARHVHPDAFSIGCSELLTVFHLGRDVKIQDCPLDLYKR